MKKFYVILFSLMLFTKAFAIDAEQLDSVVRTFTLDEVTVSSVLRSNTNEMQNITADQILKVNDGQEPSHVFKSMPSIYAREDNGTEFGYGYYYIRGLDQTRINVTLDGMPWNEAEDFGTYFANSPDLMASLHSMSVERGASSKTLGISASAGNINMESVNLRTDTTSYLQAAYGSFNTYKVSGVYNMGIKNGFGFHIRATQSHTDGFRENSWNNSRSVAAKLGYYFNDRHSIDILSINGYHRNCQGWIGVPKAELDEKPKANGNTRLETDNWIQTIDKISYKGWLSDNTVLMASAYLQYQTGSYRFDLDNYMTRIEAAPMISGIVYDYGLTHYLYGGNVIVKSNQGDFMDLYAGVNAYGYQREHYMDNRNKKHWQNVDSSEFYDNIGYKLDVTPFLGVNYKFGNFNIGGNLQFRYVNFRYNDITDQKYLSAKDLGTEWCFLNGGIDLNYRFNNEHDIYAKLAVSNREPTRTDMFDGQEHIHADTLMKYGISVKPEMVHDVEVGWNLNNKYVKANVNLYYMHFKNELILNGNLGLNGLPGHVNADKSFRTGVEVSFDAQPVNGLHIVNATSYSYGKVNKTGVCTNATHAFFPSWTLNQDVHYDALKVGCVDLMVGLNYNLRSSIYVDLTNTHKLPVNMTLNAYCGMLIKNKVEVNVKFNNITNHLNYSYGTVNAAGEMLYVQECGFNCLASVKYLF